MRVQFDVSGDHDLSRAISDLKDLSHQMPWAAKVALNKTMDGVKTDMPRILNDKYNFKVGVVKKRISITKANKETLTGVVTSRGGAFHLSDFTGTSDTIGKAKVKNPFGVVVNVRKDTGPKLIPRAFLARGRHSGKVIVLRRPGNPKGQFEKLWGRYGPKGSGGKSGSKATIDAFYGPYPETLYNSEQNWAQLKDLAAKRLDKEMGVAIDAELRKQAGKW